MRMCFVCVRARTEYFANAFGYCNHNVCECVCMLCICVFVDNTPMVGANGIQELTIIPSRFGAALLHKYRRTKRRTLAEIYAFITHILVRVLAPSDAVRCIFRMFRLQCLRVALFTYTLCIRKGDGNAGPGWVSGLVGTSGDFCGWGSECALRCATYTCLHTHHSQQTYTQRQQRRR